MDFVVGEVKEVIWYFENYTVQQKKSNDGDSYLV